MNMTIQASDSVRYNKKKYTLIDVEKDKQMIDCAKFVMPVSSHFFTSACWRGYTAEYTIENGKLYGIRTEYSSLKDKHKSDKMFVEFTGSCVIAIGEEEEEWCISDFLECYLDYKEALELHFTNGVLDEVRDLTEAIKEATLLRESEEYINKTLEPQEYRRLIDLIARKFLKYEYGFRSYMWRGSGKDVML